MLLSKKNGDFSSYDPFLSFNVDKNWLLGKRSGAGGTRFHSFFDARLTAVPVQARSPKDATLATLIASSKAASLTVGAYLPVTVSAWHFGEKDYSLFLAPLYKTGFITAEKRDDGLPNDKFFVNQSYGFRVGHVREYREWDGAHDKSRSPEPLSYLDFTFGKFANFETVHTDYQLDANGAPLRNDDKTLEVLDYLRYRPWRFAFEGVLKVPHSPFLLGVSGNIGFGSARVPASYSQGVAGFSPVQDDLRFLFGARFDVRKLLNKVVQLGLEN